MSTTRFRLGPVADHQPESKIRYTTLTGSESKRYEVVAMG